MDDFTPQEIDEGQNLPSVRGAARNSDITDDAEADDVIAALTVPRRATRAGGRQVRLGRARGECPDAVRPVDVRSRRLRLGTEEGNDRSVDRHRTGSPRPVPRTVRPSHPWGTAVGGRQLPGQVKPDLCAAARALSPTSVVGQPARGQVRGSSVTRWIR